MLKILFEKRVDEGFSPEQRAVFHMGLLKSRTTLSSPLADLDRFSTDELYSMWPVGGVEFIQSFFRRLGKTVPVPNPYPLELSGYLGRTVERINRVKAQAIVDEDGRFVKPATTYKTYTGSCFFPGDKIPVSDQTVWVADIVKFISEVRVYVVEGQIAGISRYDDFEFDLLPDTRVIAEAVSLFETGGRSPAGYALDFGLTDKGTLLVEFNDGWALGYYPPMDPLKYSMLLESRMIEMLR